MVGGIMRLLLCLSDTRWHKTVCETPAPTRGGGVSRRRRRHQAQAETATLCLTEAFTCTRVSMTVRTGNVMSRPGLQADSVTVFIQPSCRRHSVIIQGRCTWAMTQTGTPPSHETTVAAIPREISIARRGPPGHGWTRQRARRPAAQRRTLPQTRGVVKSPLNRTSTRKNKNTPTVTPNALRTAMDTLAGPCAPMADIR
jgi:hypothetical protein